MGKSTADYININGIEYQVENVDGQYIAFNDEYEDIELSPKDVLQMFFDKNAFADFVKDSLGIKRPLVKLESTDGFYLGDLSVGKGYRVFLCYSDSITFARKVASSLDSFQPLIISFGGISKDTQKLLFDKKEKCFWI